LEESKPILTLGMAFMFTGLLWTFKDLVVRSMITRTYGLDSVGIYQAAWAISGLFVKFVLGAMGTDFYPRLTTLQDDHPAMVRAINQQIEIGVLLALPGVIATISCAPMVILLLYSPKFHAASELLAVLSCGVFFKVISYPLNLVQLAKGDARGFTIYGTGFALIESGLTVLLLMRFGMIGAALAYPISCFSHVIAMSWVGTKAIEHRFNPASVRLILISLLLIGTASLIAHLLHGAAALGSGILLSMFTSLYCLRALSKRLGSEHRFIQMALKIPGMKELIS
jgi:PST family polysaccharide transporter